MAKLTLEIVQIRDTSTAWLEVPLYIFTTIGEYYKNYESSFFSREDNIIYMGGKDGAKFTRKLESIGIKLLTEKRFIDDSFAWRPHNEPHFSELNEMGEPISHRVQKSFVSDLSYRELIKTERN
jgi:hypothetical protein